MEVEEAPRPFVPSQSGMSVDDYINGHWTMLRDAIDQMLTLPPGTYKPISYEQMYSAVYKCVCKQYGDRLYQDLINHMRTRLTEWSKMLSQATDSELISQFHKALAQYFNALSGIVPIFTYMNRFYIEAKLHTDLRSELLKVFSASLSDQHVKRLLGLMTEAQSRPFSVEPQVMANICTHLNQLNPDYLRLAPHLFASFLPNILPPMIEEDIQAQREADRQLQESLRAQGWGDETPRTSTRKRENEDGAEHYAALNTVNTFTQQVNQPHQMQQHNQQLIPPQQQQLQDIKQQQGEAAAAAVEVVSSSSEMQQLQTNENLPPKLNNGLFLSQ